MVEPVMCCSGWTSGPQEPQSAVEMLHVLVASFLLHTVIYCSSSKGKPIKDRCYLKPTPAYQNGSSLAFCKTNYSLPLRPFLGFGTWTLVIDLISKAFGEVRVYFCGVWSPTTRRRGHGVRSATTQVLDRYFFIYHRYLIETRWALSARRLVSTFAAVNGYARRARSSNYQL